MTSFKPHRELTCCCEDRINGEKNPKHKLCFLGNFLQHTTGEQSRKSRHILRERNRKVIQASVYALMWTSKKHYVGKL